MDFIGDANALKEKFAHKNSWEGDEQSGANSASDEVLKGLHTLNIEYDLKNGFIFLICATGKSASEMLQALQTRLRNDRDTEVRTHTDHTFYLISLISYLSYSYKSPLVSKPRLPILD